MRNKIGDLDNAIASASDSRNSNVRPRRPTAAQPTAADAGPPIYTLTPDEARRSLTDSTQELSRKGVGSRRGMRPPKTISESGFISNEAGRVKLFLHLFLPIGVFCFLLGPHPSVCEEALFYWTDDFRPSSVSDPCPPYSLSPWSLHHFGVAHQPSLRSLWTMMCLCELPLLQGGGVA